MDNKIVNFPNQDNNKKQEYESEHEIHKCDSCASYAIYEMTNHFEYADEEAIISECISKIFEAIDDEDSEAIMDAVIECYQCAYHEGNKDVIKGEIQRMASLLNVMTSEPDGEEQ